MKRSNILAAAVLSFGAMTIFGQVAQADSGDRDNNHDSSRNDNRGGHQDRGNSRQDNGGNRTYSDDSTSGQNRSYKGNRNSGDSHVYSDSNNNGYNHNNRADGYNNGNRNYDNNRNNGYNRIYDYNRNNGYDHGYRNDVYARSGRYYRGDQIFNGSYGGFYYRDGFRFGLNVVYLYGDRYYYNDDYYTGYYDGYRYEDGYRCEDRDIEGVIINSSDGWYRVRDYDGHEYRIRNRNNAFRNYRRGDSVRVSGVFSNGNIFANLVIHLGH